MRKVVLVYNPVSGNSLFKHKLDEVFQVFGDEGICVIPYRTRKEGLTGFVELVQSVSPEGVLIAGGDGTVSLVVQEILCAKLDVAVGILPSGTSNDFARYVGLSGDLPSYARAVAENRTMMIDVGQVNDRYFINVVGAGLAAGVAHSVHADLKNTLGKMAYYLRGIGEVPRFRPMEIELEIDGVPYKELVLMFLVLNSGTVAGFPNVLPAKINDGMLDIVLVNQCSWADLVSLFVGILAGKDVRLHKCVQYYQAQSIKVCAEEEIESDIDGELGPYLPLEIKAVPAAVRLYITK